MKRTAYFLLGFVVLLGLSGCTIGMPRSEYEKVVSERDDLQSQIELLEAGWGTGFSEDYGDREDVDGASSILSNHQWDYEVVEPAGDYLFVKVVNDTGVTCGEIKATAVFYDGADMLSTDYNYYLAVPDGRTIFFPIWKPYDSDNYELIPYDRVEVTVTAQPDDGYVTDCSEQLETTHNPGTDSIMIKCQNNGDEAVDTVRYQVVFYNNKGEVITVEETYNGDPIPAGSSQVMSAYTPYDWNLGSLPYDHYEVYLVESYR